LFPALRWARSKVSFTIGSFIKRRIYMKGKILILAFIMVLALAFATACRSDDEPAAVATPAPGAATPAPVVTPPPPQEVELGDTRLEDSGLEIVSIDGEDVFRFTNTRNITVGVWNRSPDRQPNIRDSYWADFIQREMLRVHNVGVEFVQIPRWEDETTLSQLLAAGTAPDVSYTFSFPTVQTFAGMDGIHDLTPIVERYLDFAPHFYELQGMTNLMWNQDPIYGHTWAFAGRHYDNMHRIGTFVRGDWLDTLGIAAPGTLQQFEDMLFAFRDNAEVLLGADAPHMIPYRLTQDVGWTGDPVISSFIPHNITDRQWFVYGFDDRRFLMPGIKEGVRVLNRWFNNGLIWEDFSLHETADPRGDDLIMLGFVGSFSGNWDYPFRAAPGIITNMQENVGAHAHFITVAPFQNDAGIVRMQVPHGTDRSLFFPATNTEIVASMLYLDWISRPAVREFLMFGYEGIHFARNADGIFELIAADYHPDEMFFPVIRNFDIIPVFNGVPPLSNPELGAIARTFPGIPGNLVIEAIDIGLRYAWVGPRAVTRQIMAEEQFGGGLPSLRDAALNQAVNASEADFDNVFDALMRNYLQAGGQAIIDERRAAWLETYGDTDWLPEN
jgi:putative aldouronate transport system substrate-binding protein